MAATPSRLILFAFALPYWCAGAPTPEELDFFEKKIRPVLSSECAECHGAKKQKGGLRVDFREGLRKGGENGAAIVPGEPTKSLLLAAIRHTDPDLEMPQKRSKLSDATIADVERWITMGAPDPRDDPPRDDAAVPWAQVFAERKQWWCFQPLRVVDPPAPADAAWSDHPVDHFLRAAMDSHGLTPAHDADPRTFIRRLTFLLTGLPPTPAEVEAFEQSPSVPHAVDRLLDSPRFGEHWARHWMDLVRYAETHGSEGDPDIPWAYLYRDYLIRAFNGDVPCDQLIREHIAGDLLPSPRWNSEEHYNESAVGTAHLRLVEHGFQPVDALDEQVKTVDSQMDVAMKAFQGLTVTCARCHDHKFDAISQRDYYALYGIFASCRPAVVTIDNPKNLSIHCQELTALKARVRAALAEAWLAEAEHIPERIDASHATDVPAPVSGTSGRLVENWRRAWADAEKDQNSPLRALVKPGSEPQSEKDGTFRVIWDLAKESDYAGWIRHGSGLPERPKSAGDFAVNSTGDRVLTTLLPRGIHTHPLSSKQNGIVQSPRFRVETNFISVRAAGGGGAQVRLVVDNYPLGNGGIFPGVGLDRDEPQWLRLDVKYRRGSWAYLEVATRKDLTRADVRGPDAPRSWFALEKVAFHDKDRIPNEGPAILPVSPGELKEQVVNAIRAWQNDTLDDAGFILLNYFVRRELLPTVIAEIPALVPLAAEYRKLEAEVPEPHRVAGVLEGEGFDAPLLPRGDHLKPGEPIPRAFLSAIDGKPFFGDADEVARKSSGRLALANAITDPRNPLTARVMVNRVWHWLFGRGIVATPDNFGKMGELPSHPELLDFLAAKFATSESEGGMGWSCKKLIRYLATTRTIGLASEAPKGAAEKDAANIYLTHARVTRLEAESIRDTLLYLSGRLDEVRFGPSDNAFAPPDKQHRRSIYLMVRRTALNPFLTVFDAPRPFSTLGRRDQTNVPAQSLTMLNDPLVHFCADEWSGRLIEQTHATPEQRLQAMYCAAFARYPSATETTAGLRYLDKNASDPARIPDLMRNRASWRDMAIALFNTKEFLYLR
jgi:cytochrome c553